ncbi:unnamed protein product [Ectocarpus fasciculatus]
MKEGHKLLYNSVVCWNLRQLLHPISAEHAPHGDCARRHLLGVGDIRLLLVPDDDRSRGPRLRMLDQKGGGKFWTESPVSSTSTVTAAGGSARSSRRAMAQELSRTCAT